MHDYQKQGMTRLLANEDPVLSLYVKCGRGSEDDLGGAVQSGDLIVTFEIGDEDKRRASTTGVRQRAGYPCQH